MNAAKFSSGDERWPLMAALTWIATRSLKLTERLTFCDPAEAEFWFENLKISGMPSQLTCSGA
jgi:hypothetical protein